MGSSNGSSATTKSREQQAKQHAARTKKKIDAKAREGRRPRGGRSPTAPAQWSLEEAEQQAGLMDAQKYFWNPLMDYWFRMEIEGWEHLPKPPALLIGIDSGAPFVWDAWTVGVQWWRRFGQDRILHGTAHDMLMATPGIGAYFRKMGACPLRGTASPPRSRPAATSRCGPAARSPRCARGPSATRPSSPAARGSSAWRSTRGSRSSRSRRSAARTRCPSSPAGEGSPRLLKLDQIARLKMFPIALSAPWGISPAILPEIPLPTKIRTAFQPPVELDRDPAKAEDDDYVEEKYEEVRQSIQDGMDPPRPPPGVPRLRLEAPADAADAALREVPILCAADVAAHPPALPRERPDAARRQGQPQRLAVRAPGDAARGAAAGVHRETCPGPAPLLLPGYGFTTGEHARGAADAAPAGATSTTTARSGRNAVRAIMGAA